MASEEFSFTTKNRSTAIKVDGVGYRVRSPGAWVDIRLAELREKYRGVSDENEVSAADIREMYELAVAIFVDDDGTKTRKSSRQRILKRLNDKGDSLNMGELHGINTRMAQKWAEDQGRPT